MHFPKWRGPRPLFRTIHLYLSLSLGIVLIGIALSGAALVWRDHVDRLLAPERYAVTGPETRLAPSVYAARALAAAGADQRIVELRYADAPSWPVKAMTRSAPSAGKAAGSLIVFLDPPTGTVLGVVGVSSTLVGVLHNLHHMLNLPQFSGRQIVGWIGVSLLLISLSGLYLWWPRNHNLVRALRWTRSPTKMSNLHHLVGFWMSLPMAVVALTGVYISFPVTANKLTASLVSTSPFRGHGYGAQPLSQTSLTIDQALSAARTVIPAGSPKTIAVPLEDRSHSMEHGHSTKSSEWRLVFHDDATGEDRTILVRDRDAVATLATEPPQGDRFAKIIQAVHEGRIGAPIWSILVFLTGVAPVLFAVTGLTMWLRRRKAVALTGERKTPDRST